MADQFNGPRRAIERLRDRGFNFFLQFRCHATTLSKVFTRMPLLPSSIGTGQGAVMPCGCAGNHRFHVALAMRHSQNFVLYLPTGAREGLMN